jgi:GNAT superfamily N-acetyltransferase
VPDGLTEDRGLVAPTESRMERLAESLPDVPRYLYARSMLLSNRCELLGLEEERYGPSFVARELEEREDRWFCVVGRPSEEAVREAARRNRNGGEVLATQEGAPRVVSALPGWTATRVIVHLLGDASRLPRFAERDVKPFGAPDLDAAADDLPEELRSYLESAVGRKAPVAASLADGRPVSFCCAEDETEGLWDIAIETLAGHRKRGHAARCVSWMVAEMRRRGKEPVWAAEETNPASLRLAAKLGFVPADELMLFQPAPQPETS